MIYAPVNSQSADTVCTLFSGQALDSGLGPSELYLSDEEYGESEKSDCGVMLCLTQKDYPKLDLAGKVIAEMIRTSGIVLDSNKPTCLWALVEKMTDYPGYPFPLSYREANLKTSQFEKPILNGMMPRMIRPAAMALIPAAYGSIHLAALSTMFPTTTERLLWKTSCYVLIVGASAYCVSVIIGIPINDKFIDGYQQHPYPLDGERYRKVLWKFIGRLSYRMVSFAWMKQSFEDYKSRTIKSCSFIWHEHQGVIYSYIIRYFVYVSFVAPFILIYVSTRIFLVVESFISLRHVPVGVYQTPDLNFMEYIPHL